MPESTACGDKRGRLSGVNLHRKRHEPCCPDCARTISEYVRARYVRAGRARTILVSIPLVAELLAAASAPTLQRATDEFGEPLIAVLREMEVSRDV